MSIVHNQGGKNTTFDANPENLRILPSPSIPAMSEVPQSTPQFSP